ncbi:MAG: hypothetical protein J6Q33_00100 [Alistipes sp.]|nr:hypothetical protein [Alistipes sp.]
MKRSILLLAAAFVAVALLGACASVSTESDVYNDADTLKAIIEGTPVTAEAEADEEEGAVVDVDIAAILDGMAAPAEEVMTPAEEPVKQKAAVAKAEVPAATTEATEAVEAAVVETAEVVETAVMAAEEAVEAEVATAVVETAEVVETAVMASEETVEEAADAVVAEIAAVVETVEAAASEVEPVAAEAAVAEVELVADVVATEETVVASEESTVSTRFLPTTRRIDRNIDLNKFVYKNEWMLGLAASYGKLDVADSELMLLVDDVNFGVRRAVVMPYIAYAYRDNRSVGVRVGYELLQGDLGNISLDLGSGADLSFSLADIGVKNENFLWSIFHRNYIGLDRRGIVGAILETELMVKTGTTSMYTGSGDARNYSESKNFAAKLNFNPGLAVYVFPQVCVTVTVGIGGLAYNNIRQYDAAGVMTGRRDHSALKFKLNIADIQIGVVAHLWNKKNN